jgi:NACHT domain
VIQEDSYEADGVPSWLETPATSVPTRLLTVTRPQLLPLNDLTWENFERICLRYARGRGSVVRTQLYGIKGQAQHGIDLYVRLAEPARYEVYQSKKLASLTSGDIASAVDKFIGGKWFGRSKAFRIMTSHEIEDTKIAEAIEESGTRLEKDGIDFEVLGALQISSWLKNEPRTVDDFFSRPVLEAFCGPDAIARIGRRLNSEHVVRYRRELKRFYEVVFNRNDPGIPVRTRIGDPEIPLLERFVVPEVYATPSPDVRTNQATADGRAQAVRSAVENGAARRSVPNPVQQMRVRSDVERWMSQAPRSVILGSPGSGKSALLKVLAIDMLSEEPFLQATAARWGSLLPVWIPFSYWTDLNKKRGSTASLSECLRTWFGQFDQNEVWLLVEAALEDDRLLLLVDGLDEWTDEAAARATSHLLQTSIQMRNLPAVLVSRPHGFERASIQGVEWQIGELAPLSAHQQRALLIKWLGIHGARNQMQDADLRRREVEGEADEFIRSLERSKDLADLAAIPLTLLLLLYLHLQNNPLPASRIEAYEYVTDHFIREHPLARRTAATITTEQSSLTPDETRKALAYLAYVVQTEFPTGTLSSEDVRSRLEGFLEDAENGLSLSRSESRIVLRSFTNIGEGSLGLLVSQGQSLVSFFHRSLQEYLAADHLARTPLSYQLTTIGLRVADRRWREVILAIVLRCGRSEEATALVQAIEQATMGTIGALAKEDLLAEIAFKDSNVPNAISKNLALRACGVIEVSFSDSHRSRLAGHAMLGFRSRKMRPLIEERIKRWIFSRGLWGPGRIQGLRGWPATEHTWEVLYRALNDEDAGVIREASAVIAHVFGGQNDYGNQMAQLALRSDNPAQRAASVESLSTGWPTHPLLGTIITYARDSASDAVRVAGLAARVRLGVQEDSDLTELLSLAQDYFGSTIDYSWRGELAETLAQGWPGNAHLKSRCLESTHHHYSNPSLVDRGIALYVLVKAFPQDGDVANLIVQELGESSPFVASDSIWPVLPNSFRDHPAVVGALDQWVAVGNFHDPIALHYGALVGRTEKMRNVLLDGINKWVPFWAVGSLLQGWGMSDALVREKLMERIARDDAAEIGQFIPEIVRDKSAARERLVTLLQDPVTRRIDFLMAGFSRLGRLEGETAIVGAAIERLGNPSSWERENYQGSVILAFSNDRRVRDIARESLTSQSPPFAAVAEAYANDAEVRAQLAELITPLSSSLRFQIVSELARSANRDLALDILKDWDTEHNPEVKAQAAIEFHSLLLTDPLQAADAVGKLDAMLPCYGPDHDGRRQAAAAGLIVLKQLQRVVGRTESIGHVGRQVNVPISDGLRRNRVFLNLLGKNWHYVKQALNDDLSILAPSIGPQQLWKNLSTVAAEYPQLAGEILEVTETDSELRRSANFLLLFGRLEPKSERLAQLCFGVIGDNTLRHEWFDSVEAAAILLAEHFGGDPKVEAHLGSMGSPHFLQTGVVMALSLGWPHNDVLGNFALESLQDSTMNSGYLYARYARIDASDLAKRLENDLAWARKNPHLSDGIIRPIAARLRRDPESVQALRDRLLSATNPSVKASFSRLLTFGGSLTLEQDAWCRKELNHQNSLESSQLGYDLLAKQTRAVSVCLLESLGELLPVGEGAFPQD